MTRPRLRVTASLGALLAVGLAAGLLLAGGVRLTPTAALGPGWEPDPNALGTMLFYDDDGKPVTGGSITDHPVAWYTVASGPGRDGDSKAQLRAYTPQQGVPPALWTGDTLTATTDYPNKAAPANIAKLTRPVASGTAADFSLAEYVGELPNLATDPAYAGLYELRLFTAGAGQGAGSSYFRMDIQVTVTTTSTDGTSEGTWAVVYPTEQASPSATPPSASSTADPDDDPTDEPSFGDPPVLPPVTLTTAAASPPRVPTPGTAGPPPPVPAGAVAPTGVPAGGAAPTGVAAAPSTSDGSFAPVLTGDGRLSAANSGTSIAVIAGLGLLVIVVLIGLIRGGTRHAAAQRRD